MSMISEQIHNLRSLAIETRCLYDDDLHDALIYAADTIESLSAKLQAENMERTAGDCGKSILKIDTPKVCIDCPCHFAGESGMVVCGVEKRELLSDDIEAFKPDWCPLRESAGDCGGWISCKDRLPTMGECQKILEHLDDIWTFGHEPTDEEREAARDAIDAVQKQIPKKIKNRKLLKDFHNTPYTIRGDCPVCGSMGLLSANTDYCNACGQKLDWSE